MPPLVSVLCLCYNHAAFLKEALDSVFAQTYPNIELIIIDDKSSDSSVLEIKHWLSQNPVSQRFEKFHFIENQQNEGVCKAFNKAFGMASGLYIIDFALDDVFLPQKIENQVLAFQHLDKNTDKEYGVIFTNAVLIDASSKPFATHYPTRNGKAIIKIPSGDIFSNILGRYFLCPPTLMVKKTVLDTLKGYDETLSYEDFDFWIRASRSYLFFYLDECSTLFRRGVVGSHSTKFYQKNNNLLLKDTLKIFEKSYFLCKTPNEFQQLAKNTFYHFRQCFFTENFILLNQYREFLSDKKLLKYLKNHIIIFYIFLGLARLKVKTFFLYKWYLKYLKRNKQI